MRQAKKIKTRQFNMLQDMTTDYKTRQDKTIQHDKTESTMRNIQDKTCQGNILQDKIIQHKARHDKTT